MADAKIKRFLLVGGKKYYVDQIPPMYGQRLPRAVTFEGPTESEPDIEPAFKLGGFSSDLSNALEALGQIIAPQLMDDGVIACNRKNIYFFTLSEDECLMMLLQAWLIWTLDYLDISEYSEGDKVAVLSTRNALLLAVKQNGYGEGFPDEVNLAQIKTVDDEGNVIASAIDDSVLGDETPIDPAPTREDLQSAVENAAKHVDPSDEGDEVSSDEQDLIDAEADLESFDQLKDPPPEDESTSASKPGGKVSKRRAKVKSEATASK